MRLTSLILCLTLLFGIVWTSSPVKAATASIRLSSNPDAIFADGRSICSITAEVRDPSGDVMSDGEEVHFTTSLGVIDGSAVIVGGVARAILRSGTQTGQAMVSAVVANGQAVAQIRIDFLPPGSQMQTDACLTVSSERYLAYAADTQVVDASGGCSVRHRGIEVEAEDIQLEVSRNILRARGKTGADPVRITRGDKVIKASLLCYDTNTLQGVMVTDGEDGKVAKLAFNGVDFSTTEAKESADQSVFEFKDLSGTPVLVKARSITIRPRHDVQFKKAELYMEGGKAFKLPLYLIPLAALGPTAGLQYFGLTSQGLKVDIPLYYSLSPTGTGAVRIRNQANSWSSYSSQHTWGLDVEQSYATGKAEGRVTVGQVTSADWGLNWQHAQEFGGNSRLTTYFAMPQHKNPFGMMTFNKALKSSSFGINLQGGQSRWRDIMHVQHVDNRASADMFLQTNPKPLGKMLNYSVLLNSSVSTLPRVGWEIGNGLQLQLRGTPVKFSTKSTLTNSLSIGQTWGGSRAGLSAYGNSMFTTSLSANSSLSLGYLYTLDPRTITNYGNHMLNFNYGFFSNKWVASLAGIYGLDSPIISAYGNVGCQVSRLWRLDVRGTFQRFPLGASGSDGVADMEFGVGRLIGDQDVTVYWSESQHRFRVEMGGLGF